MSVQTRDERLIESLTHARNALADAELTSENRLALVALRVGQCLEILKSQDAIWKAEQLSRSLAHLLKDAGKDAGQ